MAITFLVVFLAPLAALVLAFLAALVLAARIARASEAPIAVDDSAEWIASFDAFDVDAEWCALADAAAVEADAIEVMSATIEAFRTADRSAFLASVRAGIAEARTMRLAGVHTSHPSVSEVHARRGARKLTSLAAFLAATVSEVQADAPNAEGLETLAALASMRGDTAERTACVAAFLAATASEVREAFRAPEASPLASPLAA